MLDVVTLLDLVQQGWYATYPLLLCSVVALAIAGERLWALRGLDARMISVSKQIGFLMRRGDVEGAADLLEREGPELPLSQIYRQLIPHAHTTAVEDLLAIADGHRLAQSQGLRRNVWILGTIGSAAPFIGLFGTVVGIMRAFHSMALAGAGGFAVVAAGISEALVATALGLGVAIVAVALYNYFQVRLGELATTMRVGVTQFIDGICAYRGHGGSRQVA
ncbi:MAG: MotA/TolQ/ExbB proton channel family protein [Deltaproteobacteria bacterium]|nr:MotA/TolQ/ExbB proton channel family protein [Deltaproteobacteria bacterium]